MHYTQTDLIPPIRMRLENVEEVAFYAERHVNGLAHWVRAITGAVLVRGIVCCCLG